MLESISGTTSVYGRQFAPPPLSESQKSSINKILADFSSESLSEEDVKSINDAFRAEGIRPSADLRTAIEAAGFEAEDLRPAGGPKGAGGPPPPPPPFSDEEAVSALLEILEDFEDETLDEAALSQIQERFQEAGYTPNQSLISLDV